MSNMKYDTPLDHFDCSDLLEQAHLAYLHGELAEARLALETILAAEPGNFAASDLLTRTIAKQSSNSKRLNNFGSLWSRNIISRSATGCLMLALIILVTGAITLFRDTPIGLAQGFGPQTVVMDHGRLGWHTVPLLPDLLRSGIQVVLGSALLLYSYWDTFKRYRGNQALGLV